MALPPATLERIGCCHITSSGSQEVVIQNDIYDELDEIDERKLARLIRIMELWCDNQRLTEEQFNGNEGSDAF